MNRYGHIFETACVTIEALTPHAVRAGRGDATHDVLLARDANGLPYIPGTSLAGVLRHLYKAAFGCQRMRELFGYVENNQGAPSTIRIASAAVHDSQNTPCEWPRQDFNGDDLLSMLALDKPLVRQRVRLGSRGAAENQGKFDVTLAPAGLRYSFILSSYSHGEDREFESLLDLLASPDFRLGHGTRSGGGAFKILAIRRKQWDLTREEDWNAFCKRPRTRAEFISEVEASKPAESEGNRPNAISITLNLEAEAGWRVGGGEVPLKKLVEKGGGKTEQSTTERDRDPDLMPQSESRIKWINGKAEIQKALKGVVLPGSAVKGALRHRLAFHYRRLKGQFVDDMDELPPAEECEAVRQILGHAKEDDEENDGQRGRLLIEDVYIENPEPFTQMHNRIDRFTGGVIDGGLFEEELLWRTPLNLKMTLLEPDVIDPEAKQALRHALEDLAGGRLPLGACGSRGHGVFLGTVKCEPELAPELKEGENEH